jgi:hypothetical protein
MKYNNENEIIFKIIYIDPTDPIDTNYDMIDTSLGYNNHTI